MCLRTGKLAQPPSPAWSQRPSIRILGEAFSRDAGALPAAGDDLSTVRAGAEIELQGGAPRGRTGEGKNVTGLS